MPNEKKHKRRGELADGSFDISDVPETPEDLEGAIADVFGDEGPPEAPESDADPALADDVPAVADDPDALDVAPRPVADELVDADEEVARLLHERDEAIEGRKRAMADFVNFRRRSDENEIRARQEGVASLVRSLLPMLDHLELALGQDHAEMTTDQLLEGVRMVSDELAKALEHHTVRSIDPAVGDDFDPNEHQAVMRATPEELPPNKVAAVLQVGYAVNDVVLRPASVSVTMAADDGG